MGLWATIKGWLNIGGVSVRVEGVNQVVPKDGNRITGTVILTTKSDKTVTKVTNRFVLKQTTKIGGETKTNELDIAKQVVNGPFELKTGEEKSIPLDIEFTLAKGLKDMGGVLGGIGKLAAFASGDKEEYFVVSQASVTGTALSPNKWVPVAVK